MSPSPPALILASRSAARQAMLRNAGLQFKAIAADINEDSYKAAPDESLAQILAQAKALHISSHYPNALVIGSDQTLSLDGMYLSKAKDIEDAREKLKLLRGKTHILCSSVAVALGGKILWSDSDTAHLTMRNFDDAFLDSYLAHDPDAALHCVGAYKIEGLGAWLFSEVRGDVFTIMGMPLLPLLGYLQTTHGFTP